MMELLPRPTSYREGAPVRSSLMGWPFPPTALRQGSQICLPLN